MTFNNMYYFVIYAYIETITFHSDINYSWLNGKEDINFLFDRSRCLATCACAYMIDFERQPSHIYEYVYNVKIVYI